MKDKILKILGSDFCILTLLIIALIIIKIPHLQLPYYWDEAWSYIPAIFEMHEQGPSLMPNSIPPDLYRGHPLFFYFLSSSWLRVFGTSILSTRLLPMCISIVIIITLYYFTKKYFGKYTAFAATVFFMFQSVFLAQSSFLLPEILIALLSMLSLNAYLSNNKTMTCIWLSLVLLTKESGIVIWFTIALVQFVIFIKDKKYFKFRHYFTEFWFLLIPAVIIFIFFSIQKHILNWYLFPEHTQYLDINLTSFTDRLSGYASYVFILMGRVWLTLPGIAALIFIFIKKDMHALSLRPIFILSLFIILYLAFSSINFYSPRYILSILPYTIILFVYFINEVLKRPMLVKHMVFISLFIINLRPTFFNLNETDHNLGYANTVVNHQKVVKFCEKNNYHDKVIAVGFLMWHNLTKKTTGYLQQEEFKKCNTLIDESTEIAIITSLDKNSDFIKGIKQYKGKLIKRFECKNSWVEIYGFDQD